MTAFESDISLTDISVRDTNVSRAVDEPVRAMILDMVADEAMTVADITDALEDRDVDLQENTVRHHVNELREAGLVAVEKMEERRGGTLKFYRATTIVLSYAVPETAEERMAEMVEWMVPRLEPLLADFEEEHGEALSAMADEMAPCPHCREQKYETYLLLTVLRRAFVQNVDLR